MIYVIGDIIIDEYWYGKTTRLSPEAPVPVVNLKEKETSLGGAANVYKNIKSIVPDVNLIGLVEPKYQYLFTDEKIFTTDKMPVKIRVITSSHYITRIDDEQFMDNSKVVEYFDALNLKDDIVLLSDYDKGTLSDPQYFINKLQDCKTIVDPKLPLSRYKNCWLLKPNRNEFEEYVGECKDKNEMIQKGRELIKELNIEHLVITLSEEGVLYISNNKYVHIPAKAKEIFDVTGAGDTFAAALACCLHMGRTLIHSIEIANNAASRAVQKKGIYILEPGSLK